MTDEEWCDVREADITSREQRGAVATFVREEFWLMTTARLYRLSEPLRWRDDPDEGMANYVVVSASHVENECIAWACDEAGEFDYNHSVSEVRGTADHEEAVRALGYRVSSPVFADLAAMQAAGGAA